MSQRDKENRDFIEVSDITRFAFLISGWHQQKLESLKHMAEIPPNTVIELSDGRDVSLEGDTLEAFKAAIHVTMAELQELPFVAIPEDAEKEAA